MQQRNSQLNPCHFNERQLSRLRRGQPIAMSTDKDIAFLGGAILCFVGAILFGELAQMVGSASPGIS
jgi:hypothetical protein